MKEIYRKLILLGLVIFIGVGTIYTYNAGNKQDEGYVKDYQSYQMALAQVQKNEFEQPKKELMELHHTYPDQANITWNLGLAYAIEGDMEKAALYYQKAVDQRPFIVQEPMFSLQFAQILFGVDDFETAKKYLEHCKTLAIPEEFVSSVDELLSHIETIK
ncbi:tetratricopeptide (TPR) repeat protein [Cytobacillus eiseniae]|uniref:Tetratricopeptide (TPR) repeat protein n=1 Tax=Cytobacillus eiseniae TaxID=762947 RepID=A0ABS4RKN6_9BACI|nr:tetratricopeptide repeat protein [Cytobacillus eiseniae]MBP2242357.1 tetratricopeptide (TPR) repeat protein [Cytobacillus eiseniae]